MVLRVATFNIRHGEALSGRIDLEAQAELLRSLRADAVFLQEVDVNTRRSGGIDQVRALADLAGFPYFAFGKCRDCDGGAYGNAILSRFRPLEVVNSPIPLEDPDRPRNWHGSPILLEQRGALRMTVEAEGETVHLICSHFGFVDEERPASARFLLELIEPLQGVVVAGGDLNSSDEDSEELILLRDALTDCAVASGQQSCSTFPSDDPTVRLDYLFTRGSCAPATSAVVPTLTSDHRPMMMDLVLLPQPTFKIVYAGGRAGSVVPGDLVPSAN